MHTRVSQAGMLWTEPEEPAYWVEYSMGDGHCEARVVPDARHVISLHPQVTGDGTARVCGHGVAVVGGELRFTLPAGVGPGCSAAVRFGNDPKREITTVFPESWPSEAPVWTEVEPDPTFGGLWPADDTQVLFDLESGFEDIRRGLEELQVETPSTATPEDLAALNAVENEVNCLAEAARLAAEGDTDGAKELSEACTAEREPAPPP